jgi:hypothetical protein
LHYLIHGCTICNVYLLLQAESLDCAIGMATNKDIELESHR